MGIRKLKHALSSRKILSGARKLLGREANGLSLDFTDKSIKILDTTTPSNNIESSGSADSAGNLAGPGSKLTYASPSPKMTLGPSGTYRYWAHNYVYPSEDFSTSWSLVGNFLAFGAGSTVNATTAPDGTTTADLLVVDSTAATATYVNRTVTITGEVTLSVYAKPSGYTKIAFVAGGLGYGFDLTSTGSTSAVTGFSNTGLTVSIYFDSGTGWYLCQMVVPSTSSVTSWRIYALDSFSATTASGNDVDGIYLWGAHGYKSPADTTYLKTTDATRYDLPYEWDTSNVLQGIRVEPAATNGLPYSASIAIGTGWSTTASAMSYTLNAATSPSGLTNATLLYQASGSIGDTYDFSDTSYTAASTVTASCYFKAAGKDYAYIQVNGSNGGTLTASFVTIDLTTGTVGTVTALANGGLPSASATSSDVGNGWYRLSLTGGLGTSNTSAALYIGGCDAQNSRNGTASGTDGVYVWCPQAESGTVATSPILTYGATATRAEDNISLALSSTPIPNMTSASDEMTLMAEYISQNLSATGYILQIDSGGSTNRIAYIQNASRTPSLFTSTTDAGGQTASAVGTQHTDGATVRFAIRAAEDDYAVSYSDSTQDTDTTADVMGAALTTVYIGRGTDAAGLVLRKVLILPRGLTDGDLETVADTGELP